MQTASPRDDEAQSLEALRMLDVLDSAPEPEFDALVQAASLVCEAPIALISLVDAERQWFKANVGLPGVTETPRELAFCAHAVRGDELFEVADAALDPRFADNPLVANAPAIRFYAGVPLRLGDGSHVGTLCVIDRHPRVLTATQRAILGHLATAAVRALEVRRQARDVASSERHFRALSEAAPLGVFATDAHGGCTYTNPPWQRIFGLTPAQALGSGWACRIHPADRAAVIDEWRGAAARRLDFDLEFRVVHEDGSLHHVRAVSRAVIGADGVISGHVGSVDDIDAQVQAGRAAAELLDAVRAQFIVSITDAHGLIIEANDAFCAISRYSRAELLGKDHRVVNAGHHPREFFAELWRRIGSGASWRGEICNKAKDGTLYWVDSTIVPLRDSAGRIDRHVAIRSDITIRKAQEDSLRKSEVLLNRTASLAQVGGWELDVGSGELIWSAETRRIHGVGADYRPALAGAIDFYAPEARPAILAAVERGMAGGEPWDLELPFIRADGQRIWVRALGSVEFVSGKPVRLSGAFQDITGRKQLELRLGASERFLRNVLDNVPALIAHIGKDQRYTLVNQAYTDWDHRSSADIAGSAVAAVHGEPDYALLKNHLDQAFQGDRSSFEVELHRRSEARALQVTFVPDTNSAGQVTGVISLMVDVTPLKRAQERLRRVMEVSPHGMFTSDLQGLCTYTNTAWQRIAGLTLQQSLGDGMRKIVHPDDLQHVRDKRRLAMAEGGAVASEHRYLRPDGTTVWVQGHLTVLRHDGIPDGFVGTVEDVTERRRIDQNLRRLNREQAAMLDSDLVGIFKARGRITVWTNRGLERIFGYGPGELLNQATRLLYPDDESHAAVGESAYPELLAGRDPRLQLQMRRKDGTRIWIDMSGSMLSDELGESMWLLADITPLKQAELLRLRAVELEAENRQLQEANRLKSMFLSNMSHEMKTPLNAVIGLAGLLETGAVSPNAPKFKSYLRHIGASGQQLLQLIDAVLDYGQAEAGRIEFKPEPVQLTELLDELVDLQRDAAMRKQIEIAIEVQASLGEVTTDPMRLKQILSVYLSNAIKFMPGPGAVTIRANAEGSKGLRIEVEDQGIGISQPDQAKLFEEFQQLSTGDTKTYQGTGMGLALARRLVEAQGGTVGVLSTLGVGSVFFLTLPCRPPASP